ncbi:MAG: nucleotidyltransferase family protein [Betaproteobacteria bacterium]|nr:nucleotidyltransferase family protein [Betaproteobacteria bacterium]
MDLIERNRDQIEALCRRRGVLSLALFGSAARDELQPGSDIDLLIEFKPDTRVGLFELENIRAELESIFGRSVDLAGPAILRNPYRRRTILRDLRAIYDA